MNVTELMHMLQSKASTARVLIWDPDSEDWQEVSCCVYDEDEVKLYSDDLS